MLRNWIARTLLLRMENGAATAENTLVVSYKTKHTLILSHRNHTRGYLSWR